jgi:hypothetical protein
MIMRVGTLPRGEPLFSFSNVLIPWREVVKKLVFSQVVKKFPAFYGISVFITLFTVPRHLHPIDIYQWRRFIYAGECVLVMFVVGLHMLNRSPCETVFKGGGGRKTTSCTRRCSPAFCWTNSVKRIAMFLSRNYRTKRVFHVSDCR